MIRILIWPAISFVAGALAAFSMAPHNLWPLLFLGLSALYWIINNKTARPLKPALCGYLFAFGYFLFSLSWIGNALLVEGNPYAWAWPLAVCGLPLILAPFTALPVYLSKRFFDLNHASGFFAFTALLAGFEWLRGHLFTGFPWNLYGYTWVDVKEILQTVALGDIYHLTLLTIIWAAAAGFLLSAAASRKAKITVAAVAIITCALSYGFGAWRVHNYQPTYNENIELRIVQPNVNQHEKWDRLKMTAHFFKNVRLSYPTSENKKTTYIVWPETALSYIYAQDSTSMAIITQALQSYPGDAYLLTGTLRREDDGTYYNSLEMISPDGEISNIYNKSHLVPFGEYIPFQKWIPLRPVVEFNGFQAGDSPKNFITPGGLNYLPLICYEIIFPAMAKKAALSSDLIVNVTNDAWYGVSAGPYQHLVKAVFRAVETGTPVLRVANTGFSALINPLGYIETQTNLYEDASEAALLPNRNRVIEKFMHFENSTFGILISLIMGLSVYMRRLRNTSN